MSPTTRILATGLLSAVAVVGAGVFMTLRAERAPDRSAIHVSYVRLHDSLADVDADSSVVAVATALGATEDKLNGMPVTVTEIRLGQMVKGKADTETLAILQIGTAKTGSNDTAPLLVEGRNYLLYLHPFHLVPGDQTGRWLITGEQGVYESSGDAYVYAGTTVDDGRVDLPAAISPQLVNTWAETGVAH